MDLPRRPVTPNKKPPASDKSQKAWDDQRREVRAAAAPRRQRSSLCDPASARLWWSGKPSSSSITAAVLLFSQLQPTNPPACAAAIGQHPRRPTATLPLPSPPAFILQARKLESELDIKVAAYGKLCSSYEYGYSKGESGLATDQVCGGRGWLGAGCCWDAVRSCPSQFCAVR